jgi:hypothetical protein
MFLVIMMFAEGYVLLEGEEVIKSKYTMVELVDLA